MLVNSLVVFIQNLLFLLGCGLICICVRHSQRLLFVKVYIFCGFKCSFEVYFPLSELKPSGYDLILYISNFSLLTHLGYMVIAIPINLSMYNSVCGCIRFKLLMFQRVTPSLLSTVLLHDSRIIDFNCCKSINFRPGKKTRSVCVCVCVHIPSAIKVTKYRTILVKLPFLNIQNVNFSNQK